MNVDNFLENIIEQIKEAQLKLGYVKEVIRLYFPKDSLCSLLDVSCGSGEELVEKLRQEKRLSDTVLGSLQFSCHGDRIGVCISLEGAAYVHDCVPDPLFLKGMIRLFQEAHCLSIEEICGYFESFHEPFVCEKMKPGTDFDYVLYFPEHKPDSWYYCIRTEMGHTIYHRFTEADYRALLV